MEIASDAQGNIWATSFTTALLLKLDPKRNAFTSYPAPSTGNGAGAMYGLLVTRSGEPWVTITSANIIAKLDSATRHFIYYRIPTEGSLPFGLVMDTQHRIWFTEAGSNKIGMLKP